ncbi:hypothetical protein D9M69_700680 [compost metagenome]
MRSCVFRRVNCKPLSKARPQVATEKRINSQITACSMDSKGDAIRFMVRLFSKALDRL